MAKIHPIETCIGCGTQIKPLIRENQEEWDRFCAFMAERPGIPKDKHIELLTYRLMIYEEANVIYFLCSNYCKDALNQLLAQIIARHRRILFWSFDKTKKALK